MASTTPAKPRRTTGKGRKPRPKKQQATSRNNIIREKLKAAALQYKLMNISTRAITDALNANFGPGGEEEIPGYKPVSHHLIHDLIWEGVQEQVDPATREQARDLLLQQHEGLAAAMIAPALQGSVAHIGPAMQLLDKIAKLKGLDLDGEKDTPDRGAITQIFIGGALANA